MSSQQVASNYPAVGSNSPGSAASVWLVVLKQELTDLWVGGRVYVLLILFSILMSVTAFLNQMESQMSLIPPKEMVFLTLVGSISFGLLIGLILGADSVSGERERATIEALLLTPASRRQIVTGKFLAALSPWPVALLLSIPYMAVFARGHDVFGQAILAGGILGTILAVAFTGFGMLTSIWSKSNKVSLMICLLVYVIFLIPTQFPGEAHKGDMGYFIQQLNPLQASSTFLEKYLVNNNSWTQRPTYLYASVSTAAVILGLLFLYAAPRLNLEGGMPRLSPRKRGSAASVLASVSVIVLVSLPLTIAVQSAAATSIQQDLEISVDLGYKTVNAGDEIAFNSVVTNTGAEKSRPLNVAMNIVLTGTTVTIQHGKGEPVDPEDWSPQRTQEIEILAPGESVEQSWTVAAILEGNYMVYLTVIPQPESADATSQLVVSSGIHVTVNPLPDSNPGGILPVAIGTPLALMAFSILLRRSKRWRREAGADVS